jgi:hypothetical protein
MALVYPIASWPDGGRLVRFTDQIMRLDKDLALVYIRPGQSEQELIKTATGAQTNYEAEIRMGRWLTAWIWSAFDDSDTQYQMTGSLSWSEGFAWASSADEQIKARFRWALMELIPDLRSRWVSSAVVGPLEIPRILAPGFKSVLGPGRFETWNTVSVDSDDPDRPMSFDGRPETFAEHLHYCRRVDANSYPEYRRTPGVLESVQRFLISSGLDAIGASDPPRFVDSQDIRDRPQTLWIPFMASGSEYNLVCGAYRVDEVEQMDRTKAVSSWCRSVEHKDASWILVDDDQMVVGIGETPWAAIAMVPHLMEASQVEEWVRSHTDPGVLYEDPEIYCLLGQVPPCLWSADALRAHADGL